MLFKIVYFVSSSLLFHASSKSTPRPNKGSSSLDDMELSRIFYIVNRIFFKITYYKFSYINIHYITIIIMNIFMNNYAKYC